jgi:hypothetical protein
MTKEQEGGPEEPFRQVGQDKATAEAEKPERTWETEAQANFKFLKELGYEVDEKEVRTKIKEKYDSMTKEEKKEFIWFFYVPNGVKLSEISKKMKGRYLLSSTFSSEEMDQFKMQESLEEAYVVATRYQQEPDEDSLGEKAQSAEKWEQTGKRYMNPLIGMLADMRWYQENGSHLNEKNDTMSPSVRSVDGYVPFLRSYSYGSVLLDGHPSGHPVKIIGIREIV